MTDTALADCAFRVSLKMLALGVAKELIRERTIPERCQRIEVVEAEVIRIGLEVGPPTDTKGEPEENPMGTMPRFYFSPLELLTVKTIWDSEDHAARQTDIAKRLGLYDEKHKSVDPKLRYAITNLAERGVIEENSRGYVISVPALSLLKTWGILADPSIN